MLKSCGRQVDSMLKGQVSRLLIALWLAFFAILGSSCAGFVEPTDEQIRREFLIRNPDASVTKYRKTFEEVAVATYEVEFKARGSDEITKQNIMLHQCTDNDWKADYRQ